MSHARGVGPITFADIKRRARELALIDGRIAITPEHIDRAKSELRGEMLPAAVYGDEDATTGLNRDPSEPLTNRGEEAPTYEGADEEKIPERLVLEGVEEAQHEQMLADRRRKRES